MTIAPARHGGVRSPAMLGALEGLKQAVSSSDGVLLRGEAGTGRGAFARAIHLATHSDHSGSMEELLQRSKRGVVEGHPMVIVDCAAPHGLERRLFGCDPPRGESEVESLDRIAEGSAIHQAFKGTLVLGQVSELPSRLQARLARMLRDEEVWVERKGVVDAVERIVLKPIGMIESSTAEEQLIPELRRRLSRTTIHVPALRERREDLPALVRHFLIDICTTLELPHKRASLQASALLSALPWQGNLAELRGLLRVLVLRVPDRIIRQADVLANIRLEGGPTMVMYGGSLKQARARFEREYVASVLAQHHGRMTEAAKTLGIQRTNLYRKVRQLSVKRRGNGDRPMS